MPHFSYQKDIDLVVIGGGITGLYQAYNHLKKYPTAKVIVIEKQDTIGGRARQISFGGTMVPSGAGVGRFPKDKKLWDLIRELKLKSYKFPSTIRYYGIKPIDVLQTVGRLKQIAREHPDDVNTLTFSQFFVKHLGKKAFNSFCDTVGYTDYINADVIETIYNYGFEDTVTTATQEKFTVPWNAIINVLYETTTKHANAKVLLNTHVNTLDIHRKTLTLSSLPGGVFTYRKIIIATPSSAIKSSPLIQLFDNSTREYIMNTRAQPFCYVYGIIDIQQKQGKQFVEAFKSYTVVPKPLQKVIPMDISKGVYMLAYTDNLNAKIINKTISTTQDMEILIKQTLGFNIVIKEIKKIYWKEGTHYRCPSTRYMHSKLLKGEAFARNQGWTDGGL